MWHPPGMTEHTYIRMRWLHDHPDEPVDIWIELDRDRFETRKVEIFRDGSMEYASPDEETGSTGLGELSTPPLAEIAETGEFQPEEVSRSEFESRWAARLSAPR